MGNNFLESSLSSVVSMDLGSSWAARSWENAYYQQSSPEIRARFQQKQMQEKEQKLLRLYESQTQRAFQRVGRGSAGSSSSSVSSTSSSLGAGKVRQLFQERRHQTRSYTNGNKTGAAAPTGWDRSYPLEPLENSTKQRLQASKSTGNLKVARGTSLERSYSNNIAVQNQYQAKTQARRSKSQVRSNHLQQNVVVDLGGSFRQLSHSQQKLYDHEDYEDDDDDVVEYPQNHYSRDYQDEENNRILLEREQRESELFNKHRIYDDEDDDDIENEDPPFQQLDDVDDFNDSSHVFQKLPNVGGRLLMENRANNNNNNVDRYKTYNATTNGIRNNRRSLGDREETSRRVTPPAAREPPQRRREQETAPATRPAATKVTVTAPARRSDVKVAANTSPTKGTTLKNTNTTKPDSGHQSPTAESASALVKKRAARSPSVPQTRAQHHQAAPRGQTSQTPARAPSTRSPAMRAASSRVPAAATAQSGNMTECKICGRNFAADRINVHENICAKTSQKKRKIFDPVKQRVKGTEAESFLRKGRPQPVKTIKKTNWRQKHEDFINSIRAAKEMKAFVAKGGKLSDLPPPPPSDYSDYVQCPHCNRRFNQQAAERHIPKCATFEFNKPKVGAAKGGQAKGAVPRRR